MSNNIYGPCYSQTPCSNPNGTTIEILSSDSAYSAFYALVVQFNLIQYLATGIYTVFVPPNEAVNQLTSQVTDTLLLENILLYHFVKGSY